MSPALRIMLLVVLVAMLGCKSSSPQSKPKQSVLATPVAPRPPMQPEQPIDQTGGCDDRLHDISGLFLMYSLMNHRLPATLEELRTVPGAADVKDFNCPVSGLAYIYSRDGLPVPSGNGRVILYDAAPVHNGQRLCIEITETGQGGALVTKVIALPEAFFKGK